MSADQFKLAIIEHREISPHDLGQTVVIEGISSALNQQSVVQALARAHQHILHHKKLNRLFRHTSSPFYNIGEFRSLGVAPLTILRAIKSESIWFALLSKPSDANLVHSQRRTLTVGTASLALLTHYVGDTSNHRCFCADENIPD